MLKTTEYQILCALGILSILFVGVNVWLVTQNRAAQTSVNARTQYLQQTGPIRDVYQEMARTLADLAVKNKDEQLRQMLGQEGFTINLPAATPEAGTGTSTSKPATRGKP